MTSAQSILTVENLSVDIDVPAGVLHAVDGVSLHVDKGETLCIVGESGCGKSITSLAIMDLLPGKARLTADRLELEGTDLLSLSEKQYAALRGNRIGMIFQDPMTSLNPVYRIGEQLEEVYLQHGKGNRKEARERAAYLLDKVGIIAPDERLAQYPHQLSGGLRQRMMIAMTLMCDPALVIADEPTTALDVTMQAQTLLLLKSLQTEFQMGMILITHDLGVVARMADRVMVMYAGHVVETGTAAEVFGQPFHPYTQGLLQCIPVPGRTAAAGRLGSIKGIVPALVGDLSGCMFRNRCDHVMDACNSGEVPFHDMSEGRGYKCHLSQAECAANYASLQPEVAE
jgi:peptide/nickel transport system ATP-binding protein